MNPLDINIHKTNLTNILIDIYKDKELGTVLGFKGVLLLCSFMIYLDSLLI